MARSIINCDCCGTRGSLAGLGLINRCYQRRYRARLANRGHAESTEESGKPSTKHTATPPEPALDDRSATPERKPAPPTTPPARANDSRERRTALLACSQAVDRDDATMLLEILGLLGPDVLPKLTASHG